jgi:geranylgeranyl pyrophosphate synthase
MKRPTLDIATAPATVASTLAAGRQVEAAMRARLPVPEVDPGRLCEAMTYAALGPGKRLRPALCLAACEAAGGKVDGALAAAVAVEFLHCYTLVHDDLPAMDDDDERRGRPTVHVVFGEAMAILAGDGLLTLAFGVLAELGPRAGDAVRTLARRSGGLELLRGQAVDLSGITAAAPTMAAIEELHAAKTGALFAAACELGGIAAGASPAVCRALGDYGMAIGIAFQHADDRDDDEFVASAAASAERMKHWCRHAQDVTADLGAPGQPLIDIAAWIAGCA